MSNQREVHFLEKCPEAYVTVIAVFDEFVVVLVDTVSVRLQEMSATAPVVSIVIVGAGPAVMVGLEPFSCETGTPGHCMAQANLQVFEGSTRGSTVRCGHVCVCMQIMFYSCSS